MKKRVAIIGFGNVGYAVLNSLLTADDFEIVGVVEQKEINKEDFGGLSAIPVVKDIDELGKVDVAILAVPSRLAPEISKELLKKGINAVDGYDIHEMIYETKMDLDKVAKDKGSVAVVAAGWDPGSDSIVRTLFEVMAPQGITYTNFGPGMSMGHSTVLRSKKGVKNGVSLTMPKGDGIHRRMLYIELEDGADFETVKKDVEKDDYFAHSENNFFVVDSVDDLFDVGHGVKIERRGTSGKASNQSFTYDMRINNPALTAQVLVAAARATFKQAPGCYTLIEIPVIDMLDGSKEALIKKLV